MKNKLILHVVFFLTGVIIGAVIMCFVCCHCKHHCCASQTHCCKVKTEYPGVTKILADSAHKCCVCYMHTSPFHDTLVAYKINMLQFHAMQLLAATDTTVSGFRIYPGIHGDPEDITSVVSTNPSGKDNLSDIYSTSGANSGPCPTSCDATSPIPGH